MSAQTLSLEHRRDVASWAADCAEDVLPLFEAFAKARFCVGFEPILQGVQRNLQAWRIELRPTAKDGCNSSAGIVPIVVCVVLVSPGPVCIALAVPHCFCLFACVCWPMEELALVTPESTAQLAQPNSTNPPPEQQQGFQVRRKGLHKTDFTACRGRWGATPSFPVFVRMKCGNLMKFPATTPADK